MKTHDRKYILVMVTKEFRDIDIKFQEICKEKGKTQSEVIRNAIANFVKNEK